MDYLFLGNYDDANNYGLLQELGITHLLNCAAQTSGRQNCAFTRFGGYTGILEHVGFTADDRENYDILQHVPFSISFINRARVRQRKVLLYCAKGINRSVAMCVAYLIQECGMCFDESLETVQIVRPNILTNPGFVRQLQEYASQKE